MCDSLAFAYCLPSVKIIIGCITTNSANNNRINNEIIYLNFQGLSKLSITLPFWVWFLF